VGTKGSIASCQAPFNSSTIESDGARLFFWDIPVSTAIPLEAIDSQNPSDQLFDVRGETLALFSKTRQHRIHLNFFAICNSLFATRFRVTVPYRA
jgi:hypothetical protein